MDASLLQQHVAAQRKGREALVVVWMRKVGKQQSGCFGSWTSGKCFVDTGLTRELG